MSIDINFKGIRGKHIFGFYGSVIPKPTDIVRYEGRTYTVKKVVHSYRIMSKMTTKHIVFVTLKEVKK